MHISALKNAKSFFDTYTAELNFAEVLDIGSQNVNGSLKDVCPSYFKYTGVDFVAGQGVDVVLDDPYTLPFDDQSVDVIVSSSVFEHSEMFWVLFLELLRILKPAGLLYLNVPSNGHYHRYPEDCWRFYPDSGRALVTWGKRNSYNPMLLESYLSYQDNEVEPWNDFVAVFLKDANHQSTYKQRILESKKDYSNGWIAGNNEILNFKVLPEDQEKLKIIHKVAKGELRIML